MAYEIIQGDCLDHLVKCDCIFADPPDNIGLKYAGYSDNLSLLEYWDRMEQWVTEFCLHAPVVWLSFNSRWILGVSEIVSRINTHELTPCVQTFTFYQHNNHDLGNAHRPIWRLMKPGTPLYPEDIKVPSWREHNGDKRAKPGGKVPGDVMDFPRVTGNSKQRRAYHPTQLHEGLIERCLRLTTKPGDLVVDPFAGTGTTLRVCKRIGRSCRLIEIDPTYIKHLREEHSEGHTHQGNASTKRSRTAIPSR